MLSMWMPSYVHGRKLFRLKITVVLNFTSLPQERLFTHARPELFVANRSPQKMKVGLNRAGGGGET